MVFRPWITYCCMCLRHVLAESLASLGDLGNAQAVPVGEESIESPNHVLKEGQRFTPISRVALAVRQKCIVRDEKRTICVSENILHERRFADASATCYRNVTSGHGLNLLLQLIGCSCVRLVGYLRWGKSLDQS